MHQLDHIGATLNWCCWPCSNRNGLSSSFVAYLKCSIVLPSMVRAHRSNCILHSKGPWTNSVFPVKFKQCQAKPFSHSLFAVMVIQELVHTQRGELKGFSLVEELEGSFLVFFLVVKWNLDSFFFFFFFWFVCLISNMTRQLKKREMLKTNWLGFGWVRNQASKSHCTIFSGSLAWLKGEARSDGRTKRLSWRMFSFLPSSLTGRVCVHSCGAHLLWLVLSLTWIQCLDTRKQPPPPPLPKSMVISWLHLRAEYYGSFFLLCPFSSFSLASGARF